LIESPAHRPAKIGWRPQKKRESDLKMSTERFLHYLGTKSHSWFLQKCRKLKRASQKSGLVLIDVLTNGFGIIFQTPLVKTS